MPLTTNSLILIGAIAFALSQVLLSIILLLRTDRRWSIQERLFGVVLFGVSAYVLTPLAPAGGWSLLASTLQTLVPGVFWLFAASLFDDHFKLKPWKWGVVGIIVLLPLIGSLLSLKQGVAGLLLFTMPQSLEFVMMALALVAVVRTWREDLVQERRDFRGWFCGIIGVYITSLLLVREVLFSGAEWLPVWQYVPVGIMMLITNALLLRYRANTLYRKELPQRHLPLEQGDKASVDFLVAEPEAVIAPELPEKQEEEVPQEVVNALNTLMEEEKVYQEMGLTIGMLAARMELPEYRLRKIINAGLGYRNFNDFLNTYRIREARERLSRETDTPVLNIALDAGYRSLSSFNKAFKETLGQTPTEFRNSHPAA
jgi:AraC-like DNA-binding protein